jgi:hypothetical protein
MKRDPRQGDERAELLLGGTDKIGADRRTVQNLHFSRCSRTFHHVAAASQKRSRWTSLWLGSGSLYVPKKPVSVKRQEELREHAHSPKQAGRQIVSKAKLDRTPVTISRFSPDAVGSFEPLLNRSSQQSHSCVSGSADTSGGHRGA